MTLSETGEITPRGTQAPQPRADDNVPVGRTLEELSRRFKDCFSKTVGSLKPTFSDLIPLASRLFSDSTFRSCVSLHEAKIPINWSPDLAIAEGARACASGRITDGVISLDEAIRLEGLTTLWGSVRLNQITNRRGHAVIGNGNRIPYFLPRDINDLVVGSFLSPLFPKGVVEGVPIGKLTNLELPRTEITGPLSEIVKKIDLISFDAAIATANIHLYAGFHGARKFFTTNDNDLSWIMGDSRIDWPDFPLPGGSTNLHLRNDPEKALVTAELEKLSLKTVSSCFGPQPVQLYGRVTASIPYKVGTTAKGHLEGVALGFGPLSATVTGDVVLSWDPESKRLILDEVDVQMDEISIQSGDDFVSLKGPLHVRYQPQDPKDPDLQDLDFSFDGEVEIRRRPIQFTLPLKVWDDPKTGFNWRAKIIGKQGRHPGTKQSIGPLTVEDGEVEVLGNGFEDVQVSTKRPVAIGWGEKTIAKNVSVSGLLKNGWGSLKAYLPAILKGGRGLVTLQGPTSSWLSGRNLKGGYRFSIPEIVDQPKFSVTGLGAEGGFAVPSIWQLIERPTVPVSGTVRARVGGVIDTKVTVTHDGTIGWDSQRRSLVARFDREKSEVDLGRFDWGLGGLKFSLAGATASLGGEVALTPLGRNDFWVSGHEVGLTGGKVFVEADGKNVPFLHDVTLFAHQLHGINRGVVTGEGIDAWTKVDLCVAGLEELSRGCEAEIGQRGMRRLPLTDLGYWRMISDYLGR